MDYREILEQFGQAQQEYGVQPPPTGLDEGLASLPSPDSNGQYHASQLRLAADLVQEPEHFPESAAEGKAKEIIRNALGAENDLGIGGAEDNLPEDELLVSVSRHNRGEESSADPGSGSQQEDSYDGEDESGSDDEEEGDEEATDGSRQRSSSSGRRRKRRNILPRVTRGQRCGRCHTCLNPQMKKACLTMRQKQMDDMRKRGELPVSLMAQTSPEIAPPPKAGLPPQAKSASRRGVDFSGLEEDQPQSAVGRQQPQLDPFTREIQAIANRKGGVEPRSLPSLQRLYQQESSLERRLVLMTVLKQSPPGTLKEAVRNQIILTELQQWLQVAAEKKDFRLAYRVIETLDKLPIDLPALQSTGIGRSLAKLRKSGPEDLRKGADLLVTKWRKAVDGEAVPAGEASKRSRESGADAGGGASKKPKISEAPAKAGKPKSEVLRQSSVDSKDSSKAQAAPLEVDDTAMFERRKAIPSLQDSVFQMKKAHQIKLLNEDAVKRLKGQEAAESGERAKGKSGDLPAAPHAQDDGHPEDGTGEELPSLGSRPPSSAFASAQLSMPLGSSRLSGFGTGITRIGGAGGSLAALSLTSYDAPMDAASRAAAAAARVPDLPPQPKKEKPKKVSWMVDDRLVLVRWFRQVDPVVAVREDAKETTEIGSGAPASAEEEHPPGFVSAAKREHENEAAALRQHRLDSKDEEETEERERSLEAGNSATGAAAVEAGEERTAEHLPMTDWPSAYRGPPFAIDREQDFGIPGEEARNTSGFQEVARLVASQPAVAYVTGALAPHTPLEPPPDTSMPTAPLSIPCPRMDPLPAPQPPPIQAALLASGLMPPVQLPPPLILPPQQTPRLVPAGFASVVMPAAPMHFAGPGGQPPPPAKPAVPVPPARPAAPAQSDGGRTYGGRGRGRGRRGRGEEGGRGVEGGRGRAEGRGARGGRRPQDDLSGSWGGRRRMGEPAKPPHLVPCKWHFGGQGCKNGDGCRFSHRAEHGPGE